MKMQRIFYSSKQMFLAALLMTKRKALPWFMFIMIVNLILGRAMKEKKRRQMHSLSPIQNL